MIKNLLNADEDPPPGTKVIIEDSVVNPPPAPQNTAPTEIEPAVETSETPAVFEIPTDAKFFKKPSETTAEPERIAEVSESLTNPFAEPLGDEPEIMEPAEAVAENPPVIEQIETEKTPVVEQSAAEKTGSLPSGTLFQTEVQPESTGETIRQSGLAYSAAIVLFGSVVFTMILGWFADLLLGSSPWGIVGGIILGGIIGFIQFFRITSQIFKK